MNTPNTPNNIQTPQTASKKKLPAWAKVLIGLFVALVVILTLMGVIFNMCAHYLTHGGAEKLLEKSVEKIIENQNEGKGRSDIKIDFGKEGFSIADKKTGEGFSIQTDQTIPQSFPKDLPIFSPSKVVSTMVMGPAQIVVFETQAPFGEVNSFYQTQLPLKGWNKIMDMNLEANSSSASYQKNEEMLSMSVAFDDNKVTVTLSHSKLN